MKASNHFFGLITLVVALLTTSLSGRGMSAQLKTNGKVTNVTLYRGEAMVSRTIEVKAPQGSIEVVVGDLPEKIVPGSLFAEGGQNVEVRAVRYRTRAVAEEPREEIRKLDELIESVGDKMAMNQKNTALLLKQSAYLDKLEGFVAPTAKAELSKGVLNAEALERITKFSFDQRAEISTKQLAAAKEARGLQKEISVLQRKRSELTNNLTHTVREAVLFLEKLDESAQSIQLNYMVTDCGWSPTYTVRAGEIGKGGKVSVEYNALIHQMSGENWSAVKLSLSTASPALSAIGPGLAPFHVSLVAGAANQKPQLDLAGQIRSYRDQQGKANLDNRNSSSLRGNFESSWALNNAASGLQNLTLTATKADIETQFKQGSYSGGGSDGPSFNYPLAGSVSISSRADQQMVRILNTSFESRFYAVATPILSSYVYHKAELDNDSKMDLLAGPVSVYLGGRFVGRGEIPDVARGQTFLVGFGADPQLRTRRELVKREEKVQGGNQELNFTYRLIIENYRDDAVSVRIFDRIPHSNREKQIRTTLGEMTDKISEEKLYRRGDFNQGILRWDVEVPAGARGETARLISYDYKLEFDRQFVLTATSMNKQRQQEFENMQRQRLKK